MNKCLNCNGTGMVPLGKGIRGIKKCDCCNGTGKAPEEYDTVELDAKVIEFIDTPDRIAEISEFVDETISVDYSGEKPVLKIGNMKIKEHGYIGKMNQTGELFSCQDGILLEE